MPTFLNGSLLPYLALALIPLIIYLINRQRYRRMPWAAMEFLLRAMQKNQRRLRLENLLLLVVRTLILLLLVFGFLRPAFQAGDLNLFNESSRSEILLIDRSYSMAARDGTRSAIDEALALARHQLSSMKKGDRVQIVRAGGPLELLYSEPQVITGETAQPALLEAIDETALAYEPIHLPSTLLAIAGWLERSPGRGGWSIHFYTDLQRRDWLTSDGAPDGAVQEALAKLRELQVKLQLHAVGPVKPGNATVVSLGCEDSLPCVDLPTSFQARVDNHSNNALPALELELFVDDQPQGSRKLSLDPNDSKVVSFPYVFREVGTTRVKVLLRADDLEEDNVRQLVLEVRDGVRVLVVDGGQGGYDSEETAYLLPAIGPDSMLSTTGERLTPFHCEVVFADRLAATALEKYDVLVMSNVARFDSAENERIERFLTAGGGVFVLLGERADADSYDRLSYRDGNGWFPFRFGPAVFDQDDSNSYKLEPVRKTHPAIAYLVETPEAGLSLVRVHGYRSIVSDLPETSTLLRLDDYEGTPMLVEHAFGVGAAMVLNTQLTRTWSNLPITPALVCLIQETLPYITVRGTVRRTLAINEPFQRIVPSKDYATHTVLLCPDGTSVPLPLRELEDGKSFQLEVPGQRSPGAYEIRFTGGGGREDSRSEWFAVNALAEEGFLARSDGTELLEAYGNDAMEVFGKENSRSEITPPEDRGGEIWRALFWSVLALLIIECVLARWFGRHAGRRS